MSEMRALTAAEKVAMGDAAALIRKHLWRGKTPPPSPDSRPWSMARDLNIWKRLVILHGVEPTDLNNAIRFFRWVSSSTDPLRMTVFYWRKDGEWTGSVFLHEAISKAREYAMPEQRTAARSSLANVRQMLGRA